MADRDDSPPLVGMDEVGIEIKPEPEPEPSSPVPASRTNDDDEDSEVQIKDMKPSVEVSYKGTCLRSTTLPNLRLL